VHGLFQSTHPRRVRRLRCSYFQVENFSFQSTHPRRVRQLSWQMKQDISTDFNPHTREGCDLLKTRLYFHLLIFQSTHPRRVRHSAPYTLVTVARFQSTHPRRVRPINIQIIIRPRLFQSTHPRRVRRF